MRHRKGDVAIYQSGFDFKKTGRKRKIKRRLYGAFAVDENRGFFFMYAELAQGRYITHPNVDHHLPLSNRQQCPVPINLSEVVSPAMMFVRDRDINNHKTLDSKGSSCINNKTLF